MKATLTALVAAIEAIAVALGGMAAVGVPAVLMWLLVLDMASEPEQLVSAIAGTWLLTQLVPLAFTVSPETALAFGIGAEPIRFVISVAPLGVTLVTAVFAARSGFRLARRGGGGSAGIAGGALGMAAAAALATWLAGPLLGAPAWVAVAVPTLWYTGCSAAGFLVRAQRETHDWVQSLARIAKRQAQRVRLMPHAAWGVNAGSTVRMAVVAVAGVVALAAFGTAVALIAGYAQVVALSQSLQLDVLANVILFILQLALLPNMWFWGIAWLTGVGFSLGSGTSVSPFETLLGPIPALPLFGAIPQGWGAGGAVAPALVVFVGVFVGAALGTRHEIRRLGWLGALIMPVAAAMLSGLVLAGAAALATGSMGPGRLSHTGPDAWVVGALAAAELGVGMLIGTAATRADLKRIAAMLPLPVAPSADSPGASPAEPAPPVLVSARGRADTDETIELELEFESEPEREPATRGAERGAMPASVGAAPASVDAETQPLDDAVLRAFEWDAGTPGEPAKPTESVAQKFKNWRSRSPKG